MALALRRVLSPVRLIALAWLGGAATLFLALALDMTLVRAFWLELAVLIWLAPLAVYDLRCREVPHMACVAVPCAAAVVYSFVTGAWPVGVIALMAVAASERRMLRHARIERWTFNGALILGGLLALVSGEAVPGAFAVLGFWLAYEAGWWAGADGLAAMTLALLWPDIILLVALGIAHLAVASGVRVADSWTGIKPKSVVPRSVPGLPVIGLAALLYVVLGLS